MAEKLGLDLPRYECPLSTVRHAGMGYVPRRGSTIESIADESSGGAACEEEEEEDEEEGGEPRGTGVRVTSPDVRRAVTRVSSAEGVVINPM